ncbi:MAG: hypothetical protein K5753_04865 [Clostridia bacterium]|nr:hypothetical protein [Clostridia bacterium]
MKLRNRTLKYAADKDVEDAASTTGRKRRITILRRNAAEVMHYRILKKILLIFVAIGFTGLMVGYSFVLLYNRTGRFSVAVDNPDASYSITLSESPDFRSRSSRLVCDQQVKITNICGAGLPKNIDNVDGQHNGDNHLAYTFYCKNVSRTPVAMAYEMTFNNVTNNIDECMRVRLYVNGTPTDYAKTRSDGTGKEDHFCDRPFAGKYVVCRDAIDYVLPEEYVKFTVVIWVEGDDTDCNDSIVNGKIKFDMEIEGRSVTVQQND